ncbi:RHS domain-containing protein [Salmonella enterica]
MFKKTVKAGEHTAALRWFWWEGDALMADAQETADPTETRTAACDIQLPGSEQARKAKLTQLAQGLTLREYVYYPYSFEPLALITHRTGPDGGCGDKDPTVVYFYHNDVNGAPMRLTDRTGAVVWRQAESGAWSARYRQKGLVSNPLRFQGQYYDEESGLHYNRYRYYEPESGRYISADPLKLGAGLNLYQYVSNPLGWIDPLGLVGCASVDEDGVLSIKNKYDKDSVEDLALRKHIADWNAQIEANGGSMTRRVVTPEIRDAATKAANDAKKANPELYPKGMSPGHTPDVGWGGAIEGPIIPLNSRVNSYIGGATQAVPVGTTYTQVVLI